MIRRELNPERIGEKDMQIEPYFMKNQEWYYFDEEEWCYKLTDNAPEKAKESYEEFYRNGDE